MRTAKLVPVPVLRRKAVVYVHQSTPAQVQSSLESQRRQYELIEVTQQHGFAEVRIIDVDLGLSASGSVAHRVLIDWLLSCVRAGPVRLEASQFLRANSTAASWLAMMSPKEMNVRLRRSSMTVFRPRLNPSSMGRISIWALCKGLP